MSGSLMDILHIIHCIHCLVEWCRCPPTILPTGEVGYNTTKSRKTGYVQVICGVLSVGTGIAAIVGVGDDINNLYVAIPSWSAFAFFIVAGIFGIASGRKQTKRLIVGHMVMSILASLAAFQMMCFMVVAVVNCKIKNCAYGYVGGAVALIEFITAIIAAAASYNGGRYTRQPGDYQIQVDDQGFNVPPQAFQGVPSMPAPGAPPASQGVPSMPAPGAPPADLPPSYGYEGIGGEPMPRA